MPGIGKKKQKKSVSATTRTCRRRPKVNAAVFTPKRKRDEKTQERRGGREERESYASLVGAGKTSSCKKKGRDQRHPVEKKGSPPSTVLLGQGQRRCSSFSVDMGKGKGKESRKKIRLRKGRKKRPSTAETSERV